MIDTHRISIHVPFLSGGNHSKTDNGTTENQPDFQGGTPDNLSGGTGVNSNAHNANFSLWEVNEKTERGEFEGSVNFETALEAAMFYVRDGWAVLPICQWDSVAGRCSWATHLPDCKTKRPLIKAWGAQPGDGYMAASTDHRKVFHWYRKEYERQGIALRLDGHALVDCDIKNGARGHESYEIIADTFALDETLTQITSTNGWHKVFRLPEGLPERWLKSWTAVTNKIALSGIDLKIGRWGLLYAEPTCTKHGFYRWVDPTSPIATLPREACDFFVDMKRREEPARESCAGAAPRPLEGDQSRYFRDASHGDRHPRLFAIAVAARRQHNASASDIEEILRWHDSRFTEPTNDIAWIKRVAATVGRY
jgi:bifunctional DNA primase/polymerase-like protein